MIGLNTPNHITGIANVYDEHDFIYSALSLAVATGVADRRANYRLHGMPADSSDDAARISQKRNATQSDNDSGHTNDGSGARLVRNVRTHQSP